MDTLLQIAFWAILYYVIFKFGENYAYYKIARGLEALKNSSELITSNVAEGVMEVEKLNGQYYAYLDNAFVGQSSDFEGIKQLIQKVVDQDPGRYTTLRIKMKE
jgi:hypothetical protein